MVLLSCLARTWKLGGTGAGFRFALAKRVSGSDRARRESCFSYGPVAQTETSVVRDMSLRGLVSFAPSAEATAGVFT